MLLAKQWQIKNALIFEEQIFEWYTLVRHPLNTGILLVRHYMQCLCDIHFKTYKDEIMDRYVSLSLPSFSQRHVFANMQENQCMSQ